MVHAPSWVDQVCSHNGKMVYTHVYTQLVCSYIGEGWYLDSVGVFVHWGRLVPRLSWCVRTLGKVGTYTQLVCSYIGEGWYLHSVGVFTQWARWYVRCTHTVELN